MATASNFNAIEAGTSLVTGPQLGQGPDRPKYEKSPITGHHASVISKEFTGGGTLETRCGRKISLYLLSIRTTWHALFP